MFRGLFGGRKSKDQLKDRLKLVLSYDRAKLSPVNMDALKRELMTVINKYFPSDGRELDVSVEQQGERVVLVANLPVQRG